MAVNPVVVILWDPQQPYDPYLDCRSRCWQCSHPVEDHLPEEQGCTHPECSCAQVPEQ